MKKRISILLMSLLLISCGKTSQIEGNKIVKANDGYYLYYDNNIIKLDSDTYLTTNKKVKDYFRTSLFNNEEQDFLLVLKKYFPHGFNGIEKGEKPANFINIPTITLKENVTIVDSVGVLNQLSSKNINSFIEIDETKDNDKEVKVELNLKDKKVYIYNANGKDGLAKQVGDVLVNKFEMKYDAKNYGSITQGITVINHKLNENELKEVLNALNYTNVDVKTDDLNNDYDLVLIIGKDKEEKVENKVTENKENSNNVKIDVISKSGNRSIERSLPGFNIATKKDKKYRAVTFPDKTIIRYNKANKDLAVKLNKKILNSTLKEDSQLSNKIVITTK